MSKKILQAAAGNAGESLYVEDVFSTYLYDGNSSTQSIDNGIDLAGEGGLVWLKSRSSGASYYDHVFCDTERGPTKYLASSGILATASEQTQTQSPRDITSFNSDGFSLGIDNTFFKNVSGETFASWSFRKAKKFFDVVTYTGDGVAGKTVAHNLGSVPAVMIIKRTSTGGSNWRVYHTSLGNGQALSLNTTDAAGATTSLWNSTTPTDSVFTLGDNGNVNQSGQSFVAYLFASDAGGFGDDGSENIIKCGSYTGNGSTDGPTIDCGFEPQWLLIKNTTDGGNWVLMDAMRGMPVGDEATVLLPNATGAESSYANLWGVDLQATGFKVNVSQIQINGSGGTMVYIAIRRPMKTPESGTEVFKPYTRSGGTTGINSSAGHTVDLLISKDYNSTFNWWLSDRMRGSAFLKPNGTDSEFTSAPIAFDAQTGINLLTDNAYHFNESGDDMIDYTFKRATGFFDVVAYTGTGSNTSINHNLGVAPELMIVKRRNSSRVWAVWASGIDIDDYLTLNGTSGVTTFALWQSTQPTATQITLGTDGSVNGSGDTYIAYLFATLDGVSKVGSYTGTGTTNNIDCGFSSSARFVMVKRTSSTGDWYVWDSARGITVGSDPFLKINTSDAEGTTSDIIQPYSSGFTLTSNAGTAINGNGETFIFLAIA